MQTSNKAAQFVRHKLTVPRPTETSNNGYATWEHYCTLLNINVARKTTMLPYNLREKASLTTFHLGLTDASDYDEAKQAFMQYFSPVETLEEFRTKFYQRFQSSDKSLEQYAIELKVLNTKAYPTMDKDVLEKMA